MPKYCTSLWPKPRNNFRHQDLKFSMDGTHFCESHSELPSELPLSNASPRNIRIKSVLHPLYKFNPLKSSLYRPLINPLHAELNPICHLLALLAHHIFHVSGLRVNTNSTTLRNIHHSSFHLTAPSPTRIFFFMSY